MRCERLLRSLSGRQIFAHVTAISEGGNIRTTPRGSPRSSRNLEFYYAAAQPRNPVLPTQTSSFITPTADITAPVAALEHSEDDDGAPTPTPSSPYAQVGRTGDRTKEKRRSNLGRPPPILKNAGSSDSSKSTSSQPPVVGVSQISADLDEPNPGQTAEKSAVIGRQHTTASTKGSPPTPRYISTRFSEQVAVSIPQALKGPGGGKGERSSRSLGESSLKSSKRGHVVHAGSVASRKRPTVMRHRSSQTSSGKPSPTSPYFGPQQRTEDEEGLTISPTQRRRRVVSPHPGVGKARFSLEATSDEEDGEDEDKEETVSDDPAAEETTKENTKENASTAQTAPPLIDPNFRSKFADRPQQHRSFTNLPSAAWRSTAAAPTAASYQASGMMLPEQTPFSGRRGSGRALFKDEIVPLKAPAPAGPVAQDDAEDETSLPRTRSQLTLLLERSKAAGQDSKGKGPAKH